MPIGVVQAAILASGGGAPAITYATWNPSDKTSNLTLSSGDLAIAHSATAGHGGVRATIALSGKHYWEIKHTDTVVTAEENMGIASTSFTLGSNWLGLGTTGAHGMGYRVDAGSLYYNGGAPFTGGPLVDAQNDILMIAVDVVAKKFWAGENGTWFNSGNPAAGTGALATALPAGTLYPAHHMSTGNITTLTNFGATAFAYTVPTGFNPGVY